MQTELPSFRRLTVGIGFFVSLATFAPAACLYPSYTFDAPEPTGSTGSGGTSASTTTGSNSGGSPSGTGGEGGIGSSSASSSSTGTLGPEDCEDGQDNNGDGKIDCADPQCGAFTCVNPVPEGWTGHHALYEGSAAGDPGGCPPAYPMAGYLGYAGLSAPPLQCSSCTCAAPTGQTCSVPNLHVTSATCAQWSAMSVCEAEYALPTNPNTCYGPDGSKGGLVNCSMPVNGNCPTGTGTLPCNRAVFLDPPTVMGGSCKASAQTPTPSKPTWTTTARACLNTEPGKGCPSGGACVPKLMTPFLPSVCISKPGDNACPSGSGYTKRHLYYDDYADQRTCTDCQCAAPGGSSCTATYDIYRDFQINVCSTKLATVTSGTCTDITGNPAVVGRKLVSTNITPGSCTPSGGQPTGTALPQGPTTFCCQ